MGKPKPRHPSLKECEEFIEELCKDKNFPPEEIKSRARLAYLINIIGDMDHLQVLFTELNYQRNKPVIK